MNKYILIVIFIVVVAAGAYIIKGNSERTVNSENETSGTVGNNPKIFSIDGSSFKFSVTEILVKKGDLVRINFKNNEGFHDWVIDEFSAKTKQLQAGESDAVEFIADKAGEFEYYCSVGQHRQMGMVGKLIVE